MMEPNELLNRYIDGELDLSEEEQFFSEISNNEEMRRSMRQIMTVKRSVRDNLSTFMPSAQATVGLFSKLGIELPQSTVVTKNLTTPPIHENFWYKYRQGIVSGVTSSILTLIIVWLFLLTGSDLNNNNFYNNLAGIKSQDNGTNIIAPNITNSENNIKENNQTKNNISKKLNYSKNVSYANNNSDLINPSENITEINESQENNIKTIDKPINYSNFSNIIANNPVINSSNIKNLTNNISIPNINPINYFKNLGLNLELTGTANWSMPKENISPSEYSKFNNMSLAVNYDLGSGLSLGGEIRRENFYQKFKGVNSLGLTNNIEQQPNFTTYCLSARYIYNTNSPIKPMLQLSLGGNSIGPVARTMLGVEYSPYSDIYFNIGAEYSYMMYKYQNELFNTSKISLCYGVGYKF